LAYDCSSVSAVNIDQRQKNGHLVSAGHGICQIDCGQSDNKPVCDTVSLMLCVPNYLFTWLLYSVLIY